MTTENCVSLLKSAGMNASYQRCKILEYLLTHSTHPTAEDIYAALRPEMPTLSKMTVYNVLGALCEKGLIRDVRIETGETRYDGDARNHGHFKCEACGKVYDFEMPDAAFDADMLEGFYIGQVDLFCRGRCPECDTAG